MLKYNASTSEAVDFHFHLNRTNQKDYYKRAYVYNPSNNMSTTSQNVISSLSSVKSLGSICLNDRKKTMQYQKTSLFHKLRKYEPKYDSLAGIYIWASYTDHIFFLL